MTTVPAKHPAHPCGGTHKHTGCDCKVASGDSAARAHAEVAGGTDALTLDPSWPATDPEVLRAAAQISEDFPGVEVHLPTGLATRSDVVLWVTDRDRNELVVKTFGNGIAFKAVWRNDADHYDPAYRANSSKGLDDGQGGFRAASADDITSLVEEAFAKAHIFRAYDDLMQNAVDRARRRGDTAEESSVPGHFTFSSQSTPGEVVFHSPFVRERDGKRGLTFSATLVDDLDSGDAAIVDYYEVVRDADGHPELMARGEDESEPLASWRRSGAISEMHHRGALSPLALASDVDYAATKRADVYRGNR